MGQQMAVGGTIHKLTPKKADAFLSSLRAGLSVSHAARLSGFSRAAWYKHRAADLAFAAAWDDACEEGSDRLEDEAVRRAVEGVEQTKGIYHQGQRVATQTEIEYSDTLLIFLLKGRRPDKYAERRKVEDVTDYRKAAERVAAELGKPELVAEIERDMLLRHDAVQGLGQ